MKPSHVELALEVAIKAKRPVFIWGAPGVGKSQVVAKVAKKHGLDLIDVRAALLDPVDLRGLPFINGEGRVHWAIPDFLPKDGKGILFLDELNQGVPLVQAAFFQLIFDRCLGEYKLPDGWVVVAAGNRDTDGSITTRMATALKNRFLSHIDFDVDLEDWVSWALSADVAIEVISFIRFRPSLLHRFDPKSKDNAFPTPRSWEFVSDILKTNPPKEIEYELIAGCVGEAAAAEFKGFIDVYRDLPDIDAILVNPSGEKVPEDPAILYAITGALSRKASTTNFGRVLEYGKRMPAEFSVLLVRDSVQRTKELTKTRAFIEWSAENSDVLI